jgi:hypothetical protein
MSNMKAITAISIGFMNGSLSLVDVFECTVKFLGRKLTMNEAKNIRKAYNEKQKRDCFLLGEKKG